MIPQRRLKYVADVRVSTVDKKSVDGQKPVMLCNYTDVYYNERITPNLAFMNATATPEQIARFALRAEDVIITKDSETPDDIAIPTYVTDDMPDVLCGYHLAIIRPQQSLSGRYLFWVLASYASRQQFAVAATGVTRFGLRDETLGNALIPIRAPGEQRIIADYLDAETLHIDTLIEKKSRMMELLAIKFRSHRWTELSSLVSGFQDRWLGVPMAVAEQPWRPTRLKFLVGRPQGGTWGSEPGSDEIDVECYRVADFDRWQASVASQNPTIRSVSRDVASRLALASDDLLLEKSGGGEKQPVGFVARFAGSETPSICSNFIARLHPDSACDPQFLTHLFASLYDLGLTHPFIKQTTGIQNLDTNAFLSQGWAIPSLSEQVEIRRRIDASHIRVTALRTRLSDQINLLRERRQSLITAAVIGELDIPGASA